MSKSGGARAAARERVHADDEDGKSAVTYYRVIDHAGDRASWLALLPVTGRTHQLRAHCAALGTPILGDGKYGGAAAQLPGGAAAHRLHLHARSLEIPHPAGGTLRVTAPLPPHMRRLWEFFGFAADVSATRSPNWKMTGMKRVYKQAATRAGRGRLGRRARRQADAHPRPSNELIVPSEALAAAIAAEWDAQQDEIRPATMPLTRLAATAIDRTATQREQVVAETAELRRHRPRLLSRRPPAGAGGAPASGLAAADRLGDAALRRGARGDLRGRSRPGNRPAALKAFAAAVAAHDDFRLTALHALTAACGSLVIALALLEGRLDAAAAFAASQLDETLSDRGLGRGCRSRRAPRARWPPTSNRRRGSCRCSVAVVPDVPDRCPT